jgi:putative oxidoreductase
MGERKIPGAKAGRDPQGGYRLNVPKLILRYPDGLFGVALLLLRLSYAAIALPALARLWPAPSITVPIGLGAAAIALALILGFGARAAALLLAVALAIGIGGAQGELAWFLVGCAGGAVALVLLGPGAWSIDAHLYGRRVIRLEPRSPERGGPG